MVRYSFPVRLFHSLQHAGLSRRPQRPSNSRHAISMDVVARETRLFLRAKDAYSCGQLYDSKRGSRKTCSVMPVDVVLVVKMRLCQEEEGTCRIRINHRGGFTGGCPALSVSPFLPVWSLLRHISRSSGNSFDSLSKHNFHGFSRL
jgi:hypothetical protein